MVKILSVNDITLNMINLLQLSQPNATVSPGSVIRDIAIDPPASQIALLYSELSKVSSQQSLRLVVGSDLDKLAKNYGLTRNPAIASNGIALLTFASIQGVININKGDLVSANNGFSFTVLNGISINAAQSNFYKSVATTYSNALQFVGITDPYAVQITVQATTAGSAGNISQYGLISTTIAGVSNITNTSVFSGGSDQEDDATFRNRILAVFSGSSIGTALGYKNTALATTGVLDAYVIGPSDPLMTRDGTQTTTDSQGNITILSEGTGGKVDVAILGSNLVQYTDSFIYRDKSNKNDPTNSANDFILGQIPSDANKTFNQRRLSDIANNTLPAQPVDAILQVTGSISGSNFAAMNTDANGVVSGNYQLIKDTGVYSGSPWGFDRFHWINNQISLFSEDDIKGQFNGQDNTTYTNILQIPEVQQNISITNENSTVLASNNSLIQLLHTPATNVTRVFNVNTGEQYIVSNQNPNGIGLINTSGIIQITGNTLPVTSNTLQVDYSWVISYDQFADYDGKLGTNNPRSVNNSIDWGFSNLVRNERIAFTLDASSSFFTGIAALPISSVITASIFEEAAGIVSQVTSGNFAGRLAVIIPGLVSPTTSIDNIFFDFTYDELYQTAQNNGSFSNTIQVSGISLVYMTTIILPNDTKAAIGSNVSIIRNSTDIFNIVGAPGSFNQNQITIPATNFTTTATTLSLNTTYIANIQNLLSTSLTSLPASRTGNGFIVSNGNGFNNQNIGNTSRREFETVQLNLSSQFFIELNLNSVDATLLASEIVSVIRLSDEKELWNADNIGTIAIGTDGNFQLIFTGYNVPAAGDKVLVVYFANDINDFQPFSFSNSIIERDFSAIQIDTTNNTFLVNMHQFVSQGSGIQFQILDPVSNLIIAAGSDGYLVSNEATANFFSLSSVHFSTLTNSNNIPINILFYKLRILNSTVPNNNGIYNISALNGTANEIVIGNNFSQISPRQVSIIRLIDGQELWTASGNVEIDIATNQLIFPASNAASAGDQVLVLFYKLRNLKQTASRVAINIADQVVNSGTLSFVGHTLIKAENILFTATATGLKQNLLGAYRLAQGLNSNAIIPSNVKIVRLAQLQKVNSTTPGGGEVLDVIATYDLFGSTLQDNTYFLEDFFSDLSFGNFDFLLPATANNTQNAPTIGDTLQITFYYLTLNDTENVSFTRNGLLYTNKSFALLNKVYISSGFNTSQSATLTLSNFNQPITGSRYTSFYNYLAPVPNERIIINYNYNQLISAVSLNIENSRPINADVLAKEANAILVDVIMDIVITQASINTSSLIRQNVQNALVSAINATSLGTTLDSSSLINTAFGVNGVAASRIITFNVSGKVGQVATLTAQNNQYLVANNITVNTVSN